MFLDEYHPFLSLVALAQRCTKYGINLSFKDILSLPRSYITALRIVVAELDRRSASEKKPVWDEFR